MYVSAPRTIIKFDGKFWAHNDTPIFFHIPRDVNFSPLVTYFMGCYLINGLSEQLSSIFGGLHRDESLFAIQNSSNCEAEQLQKRIRYEFLQNVGLGLSSSYSIRTANFLDMNLDLQNNTLYPYRKPGGSIHFANFSSTPHTRLSSHFVWTTYLIGFYPYPPIKKHSSYRLNIITVPYNTPYKNTIE